MKNEDVKRVRFTALPDRGRHQLVYHSVSKDDQDSLSPFEPGARIPRGVASVDALLYGHLLSRNWRVGPIWEQTVARGSGRIKLLQ